jgi:hypothetical protein
LVIGPLPDSLRSERSTDGDRCEIVGFHPKLERQTSELSALQDSLSDSLAIALAALIRRHAEREGRYTPLVDLNVNQRDRLAEVRYHPSASRTYHPEAHVTTWRSLKKAQ